MLVPKFSLACVLSMLLAWAGPAFGQRSLAPPQVGAKAPAAPAMALIVVQGDYQHLGKLNVSVNSAMELALAYQKIGFQVQVLIDPTSLKAAKESKEWKEKIKAAKTIVFAEAKDAPTIKAAAEKWLQDAAKARSPLAFLVMSGHGEQRPRKEGDPESIFLTAEDKQGEGGISVLGLRDEAMAQRNPLPLVIIYDACRAQAPAVAQLPALNLVGQNGKLLAAPVIEKGDDAPKQSPSLERWTKRQPSLTISYEPKGRKSGFIPTILYSTRPGEKAIAGEDLIQKLARGLDDTKGRMTKFLEWKHAAARDKKPDLNLYDWFHFGLTDLLDASKLAQAHQIVVGHVPLQARVAVRERGVVVAPKRRDTIEDVLTQLRDEWSSVGGAFPVSPDPVQGWTVSRPTEGDITPANAFAGGSFGVEYDPRQRFLQVEVIAHFDEKNAKPKVAPLKTVAFELAITHVGKKGETENYLYDSSNAWVLVTDVPYRLTIPLTAVSDGTPDGVQSWNGFALGAPRSSMNAWPAGVSIRILDLKLIPENPGATLKLGSIPLTYDLLSGDWFPGDRAADSKPEEILRVTKSPEPKSDFRVKLENPNGEGIWARIGGTLLLPAYVPHNGVLQVEAANPNDKPATIVLDLLNLDDRTGKAIAYAEQLEVRIPANERVKVPLKLKGAGYANYLAVSTQSKSVSLKSLTVMPGK